MRSYRQINRVNTNRKPRILAVFAHPDDESFLMGGTLAHYALNGVEVALLCLTHGEKGYSDQAPEDERQRLMRPGKIYFIHLTGKKQKP